MKFVLYTHSLVSDWNHGNAHFQRGVLRELVARGHQVLALEPADGWSRRNLVRTQGAEALDRFTLEFPELPIATYASEDDHDEFVADADVVIVHEWAEPALIARLGKIRRDMGRFTLLFHDTHHRAVSAEREIADLMLQDYDGILCFGESLRERYARNGRTVDSFTWHEAADVRLFKPYDTAPDQDVVWIGNWGDGERACELREFLLKPIEALGLNATVHGVRYPRDALKALSEAGISYRGWISNTQVPATFANHRLTLHIPRRPYVQALPGIPTIRVFEALACGIPLISAPWCDCEHLFRPGDFFMVRDRDEMTEAISGLLHDSDWAEAMARQGLETILARHTCGHRVDELFAILARCGTETVRRETMAREAAE
jgi:spore maturation protein CgeB